MQRAEATRIATANAVMRPKLTPEPDHQQASQLYRELAEFEERAKLAAGLKPTEPWLPIE